MAEKRLSAQEVLERRKKAKEAGTYNGASSSSESRNVQEVLERRNRAKEAGTYKAYEPKKVQSVAPSITNEQAKALTNQKTTGSAIRKYKEQQQDRYGTSDSRFEGLTNPTYQNYLDNIQIHATEQKHFDWLKEQASNLESMKRYPEIAEAVKAYHTARWNPLEYMQKYDAENVLKKYGYDEEGIKSLVDTYNRERNALASAAMKERADELTDSGLLGKAVAKLEGFGANMVSIFAVPQEYANTLKEKNTGEYNPLDTNSAFHALGEYRDRIEQNITEDIESTGNGGATLREALHKDQEDTPTHRKALGDVYQAASSVANNLATAGAFGQAGALAVMGSQAAQSTINDTFKRTGDNTKSALTGTAAGLIEAGTEKLSLDHLWDIAKGTGKALTRSTLVNLIAQSGIEGTEEMTSEALNTLVDRLINQQDSNYELNVQNYINQGYSEEEARDKAFNDFKGQVKEAGTIGALAGGIGGGVAVAANKLGQHSTGADAVQTGQMEQIVAQAQTYNDKRVQKALKEYQEKPSDMKAGKLMYEMYTVDEIARNQEEKKDKGNLLQRITKNRKEGQNSQPHNVAEENQTQSVEQKPRIDVENAITRMSEAQNAEELSDVMHEVEDNGTEEQIQEARSYYEMRGAQMVVEGKTTNEELAFTGMQMSEAKAYEAGSKNEAVAPEKLSLKGKIAYNEGQQSYIKELARKNIISNTKEVVGAKATDNTGKELVIQDIVLEEREPSVRTSNGTVNLKDISFQNEAVGILYNNASTLGSTKAAQAYVKNYPGNIMVNGYHDIVQSILKDGELGLDINKVLKRRTGATYWIGEEGVKEFYALGQERAKESNRQLETVKRKGKGQLMDKRRGKTEEPLMKVLEQIAERTGLDIEVSDKEVSEVRGYFEESMSRIVLNADANMFETVFHELGEFTDSWNTEGMQKFQTALLDWYFETHDNDKMQNLIESVQNIYKQQEGSKTYREAANEIVNDAISGLFATETGAKDFAEWLAKNRTETETKSILQTITDFLKDLCGAIRKYIAGHNLTATTRTTMEVGEERAKELRQQFLDAMEQAVEKYQKAERKKENNTTKRLSLNDAATQAEKQFAEEYDAWDKINPTKVFKVSVASKALKEIGIDDKSITMDSSKIIKIRSKHKGMTDAVIKKIPRVINEPMLILESKNTPSRVVMLGELVDEDGKTVLVVLELNPTNRKGIALDEIKIASAYGKDNLQKFVNASKILYVHPDNTKTSSWLTSTRLQLPVESLTTGSTDSIPSTNSVVKNDLRYSLNDATDLSDFWFNNDNLEEPIGNAASILEEGAKLLQGKEVDTESIRRIARGMVKEYRSHYNVDALSENLEKLFSYMQSQEKVSYDDMVRIMTEVTMPVIEESTGIDETQQEIYKTFKKNLRNMSIKLSAHQKEEVAHYYDSYENFRRKMFGTLSLSESGISLDELWLEISDMSQGFIDLDVTETDQPIRLVEALEQMKPQVVNNFGADNHGVAMDMALRIYEEYFKAQHSAKVRSLEIQMRKDRTEWQRNERLKYDNNLREMRIRMRDKQEKFDERVLKIRAQYRTSELQRKYDQDAAEYRYKIKKDGNELVRWIEHPTHQKHVPKELKGMVLEFLDCIDFISHRAKEDSKTTLQWRAKMLAIQKELEVTNVHMEAGTAEDSQLKNFLQTLNPDFLPTLDKFLNDSERVEKISQMGYSQLKELEFLVRTMKTAVVKANELHANKLYRYAADAGTETLRELNARTKRKGESKIVELTGKVLSLDLAEPKTYFERLGEGATSIYKEIRKGMNKRIFLIREAREYMEEILKDVKPEELKNWVGDEATVHIVQAKEGKIQLTTGQIMSLYLLSKRNQGRVHILQGGIRATEVGKGKNRIVQNKEVHLSQAQLAKIIELLTPEQKALADKMQKFLADNCAKWGNEVHMQMYEYEMFNDEKYFPIRTVEGQHNDKGKQDDTGNAYAVKNLGFTKSIQKKAPQAIWAEDIMEAFVNHTVNMATYNAYLIPLADAMKWFNFNNAGFEGEHFELDSVHGVIEEVYGKQANTYFKELLYEINGREKRDSKAELMKVLTRNMKKASVMGSLSVMVQQPTAYVRALNVLDAKDLLGALNSLSSLKKMKENAEEAIQYSAIAQWKDWGFFEAYMGKSMQQVIAGQRTTMEKIEDFASAGAQKADKYTWGVLWNACKKEIARARKDLEIGSKEFFEVVTERFDEVIDETQVVDSILHKCPALKSDGIISMEMAFMNEPIKSYNMLYRAADHLAREESTGFKKMQKAFLNKKFGRATTAYLLSNLLTSMAASLVYALRDDKEEPFCQRYWNWLTDTALDNLNPLSMIPIAKSVISLLQGYEVERMDMQGISTVITAVQATQKKITQPDKSTQTWYGVAKKFARGLSTLHGDSFYNVWRDAESIFEEMASMNIPESESNGDLYEELIWSEEGSNAYERAYKKLQKQKGKSDKDIKKGVRSKLNTIFKEGELTEEEAEDALRRFGYTDVSEIVKTWKENMEK